MVHKIFLVLVVVAIASVIISVIHRKNITHANPQEARTYFLNYCNTGVDQYDQSKECRIATTIISQYENELLKDTKVNKLAKLIKTKNIKCEWTNQVVPECIAIQLRLNQIDKYKTENPYSILVAYQNSLDNYSNQAAQESEQTLINKNTLIAESILQNM